MRRTAVAGAALLWVVLAGAATGRAAQPVSLIELDGAITPITDRLLTTAVERAQADGAQALVVQLNTPGGLERSMRTMAQTILNAGIPVIVYVAPTGARAASAGVFITMAAHVAAMAPATNIGAAHPVTAGGGDMGKEMSKKVANDAAAFARSLAAERGRNVEWAEKAVRSSVSVTEREAVKRIEIRFRDRFLALITDPNIAYILMMVGMLGIFFELQNPGVVLPGVIGGISLILAFFAFQSLPINWAGVLLILFGVALLIAEIKIVSHGVLTAGGVISMVLGSFMLYDAPEVGFRVSWTVIIPTVGATAGLVVWAVSAGMRAMMKSPVTGAAGMIGRGVVARSALGPEGQVQVDGEIWRAVSEGGAIPAGEKVRVMAVDGLTLKVSRAGDRP